MSVPPSGVDDLISKLVSFFKEKGLFVYSAQRQRLNVAELFSQKTNCNIKFFPSPRHFFRSFRHNSHSSVNLFIVPVIIVLTFVTFFPHERDSRSSSLKNYSSPIILIIIIVIYTNGTMLILYKQTQKKRLQPRRRLQHRGEYSLYICDNALLVSSTPFDFLFRVQLLCLFLLRPISS